MQFVDEEDDLPFALLDFLQNRFQPFLKFASVLCAGDQRAHIKGKQFPVLQSLRNVSADDTLGQAFYDRRLAYARFADQNRVVLRLPGKDTDHVADLTVPADHRIQLLLPGLFYQIIAVFLQRVIGSLRVVADNSLVAPYCGKSLQERLSVNTVSAEKILHRPVRLL